MTDKIKKLEPLAEDVQPEFPTLSRGGYVEDTVDDWLSNHLKEVNKIIEYQNYGVEVVNSLEEQQAKLEEELAAAHARLADIDSDTLVAQAGSADHEDVAALREELAAAHARIHELENAPLPEFPSAQSETMQASILLQHATQLGAQYIDKAKADGEQIRKDAEAQVVELRVEIEDLEAHRFATFRSLDEFFSQELAKLRENNVFALAAVDPSLEDEDVTEEEADLVPENEDEEAPVVTEPSVEDEEADEDDDEPSVEDEEADEDDDEELETSELLEEDEDSEGNSK